MKLEVRFSYAAEEHLKDIGWHPAENVAAAVYRFAETGRGDVERTRMDEARLRIGVYSAWFLIDRAEGVLHVMSIYGPRPRPRRLL